MSNSTHLLSIEQSTQVCFEECTEELRDAMEGTNAIKEENARTDGAINVARIKKARISWTRSQYRQQIADDRTRRLLGEETEEMTAGPSAINLSATTHNQALRPTPTASRSRDITRNHGIGNNFKAREGIERDTAHLREGFDVLEETGLGHE